MLTVRVTVGRMMGLPDVPFENHCGRGAKVCLAVGPNGCRILGVFRHLI